MVMFGQTDIPTLMTTLTGYWPSIVGFGFVVLAVVYGKRLLSKGLR